VKNNINISKQNLWHYVNIKLNRAIHRHHVLAVITLLFEEMVKDLRQGKEIIIANFGTIALQPTKPRWYHNVRLQKMMLSPGYHLIKIILTSRFHKKLVKLLDIDKTLRND
jgi:nucleoid DNA-binding protein